MNVVTWRAGRVGKGWVLPDGSVRAWSVNAREQPHHADVEHSEGSVRFRISPEGEVELFGSQSWQQSAAEQALRDHLG